MGVIKTRAQDLNSLVIATDLALGSLYLHRVKQGWKIIVALVLTDCDV